MKTGLVVGIIIVVLAAAGAAYYVTVRGPSAPEATEGEAMMKKEGDAMMEKDAKDVMMKGQGDAMEDAAMMKKEPGEMMANYEGTRLGGNAAPLLDFTKADYQAALASDKLVVLYFYANWCPICAKEFPLMQAAFNELTSEQVIGFRVNFNDNQTDADEVALARQFGVAYQHTKVFVRGGQQVLKSPESWTQSRYSEEISRALAQQ